MPFYYPCPVATVPSAIVGNPDADVTAGVGGFVRIEAPDGDIEITAASPGSAVTLASYNVSLAADNDVSINTDTLSINSNGDMQLTISAGQLTFGNIAVGAGFGISAVGDVNFSVTPGQNLTFNNIPTSLPATSGSVWLDVDTLKMVP